MDQPADLPPADPPPANPRRLRARLGVAVVLVALVVGFFALGLNRLVGLEALRANQQSLAAVVAAYPLLAPLSYGLLYAGIAALSLPLNVPLALGAGALFGLWEGALVASFASATGATLALLSSRFLFRDAVQRRFGRRLADVEEGIRRDGVFYLLTLRLMPVVPYTVVNLLFGVTGISAWRFYWVSQVGMFPAALVYVNAGTQLNQVHGLSDILSSRLVMSLLLLAVLPLLARFIVARARA